MTMMGKAISKASYASCCAWRKSLASPALGFQSRTPVPGRRLDAFGGGAHVIDLGARKSISWTSTHEWLDVALRGEDFDAFCNGASAVNG